MWSDEVRAAIVADSMARVAALADAAMADPRWPDIRRLPILVDLTTQSLASFDVPPDQRDAACRAIMGAALLGYYAGLTAGAGQQ